MARLKYYSKKTNAWETVDSTFGTGNVKTVNGVEPDANGNIEIAVPGMPEINYPVTSVNGMTGDVVIEVGSEQNMVQSDLSQNDPEALDYVKNRTHWEENNQTVIEWDGNTEGREMLALTGDHEGAVCYKVHNNTPTQDELFGGVLGVDTGNGVEEVAITEDVFESTAGFNAVNCLFIGPLMIAYSTEISLLGETYTLQSTGIFAATYFRKLTYGSTVVHQLDEKFIPDSVARVEDMTWENLPDKPFCDNQTVIEWDGNDEGLEVIVDFDGVKVVKVSDKAPTDEELVKAVYTEEGDATVYPLDGDRLVDLGSVYLIGDTGCLIVNKAPMEWQGVQFATNGIYHIVGSVVVTKLTYGSTKTIEEKYIPDSIARKSDIPAAPVTSVNGMTGNVVIEIPEVKDITVNGIKPDENGNIEIKINGGSGCVSSWNDLTDKPFYDANGSEKILPDRLPDGGFGWVEGNLTVIEWNGNTEGRDSVAVNTSTTLVKVSDALPDVSEFYGATIHLSDGSIHSISQEYVDDAGALYVVACGEIPVIYCIKETSIQEIEFPSTGLYTVLFADETVPYFTMVEFGTGEIHKIDEKFIPDTVVQKEDIAHLFVQNDWNQNDRNQLNFVKNRTHWEKVSLGELQCENQAWELKYKGFAPSYMDGYDECAEYKYKTVISEDFTFKEGEMYCVTINGVVYNSVARIQNIPNSIEGYNSKYFGNIGIIHGREYDTGEPFLFYSVGTNNDKWGLRMLLPYEEEDTIVVSISLHKAESIVHKLDARFIPTNIIDDRILTEREYYDEIRWDGSLDERDNFTANGQAFYKIAECVPAESEIVEMCFNDAMSQDKWFNVKRGDGVMICVPCRKEYEYGKTDEIAINDGRIIVVYKTTFSDGFNTYTAPSTGVYSYLQGIYNDYFVRSVKFELKKISPSYLPSMAPIADLTAAPTMEDFNALLAALRSAGYLAT